jgi:hypothetical protein
MAMKRTWTLIAVAASMAGSSQAATLTVTPDHSAYAVGSTITLTVVGDPQGESTAAIYGRLVYSAALSDPSGIAPTQNTHTFSGPPASLVAPLRQGEAYGPSGLAFSEAFDQIFGTTPRTPQENTSSVIKVIAAAEGTLDFSWEVPGDGLGNHVKYFGAAPGAPAATVTIVPEPGVLVSLAAGGFALGLGRRRRSQRAGC